MATIKVYTQQSNGSVSVKPKKINLSKLEATFKRYANVYRCAHGKFPEGDSIKTELGQYEGVSIEKLHVWMGEVRADWNRVKEQTQQYLNRAKTN